jgi:hypothetical protein
MPNGKYNGQNPMRLVSTKTPANTNNIMPIVPVTCPVKYNAAKIIATMIRIILSVEPMFAFITLLFF